MSRFLVAFAFLSPVSIWDVLKLINRFKKNLIEGQDLEAVKGATFC
jgi:hypothetical protein